MLKKRYIEFEKQLLADTQFSPYELTARGLKDLRRNLAINFVSLAVMCVLILQWIRQGSFYDLGYNIGQKIGQSGSFLPIIPAIIFLVILFLSFRFFLKTLEDITETGLFMRVSVSDELQDEWELEQKRKSFSAVYEIIVFAMIGLFICVLLFSGIHYLVVDRLPNPPRFGTGVVASILAMWAYSLSPITYLAWTLKPIKDDGIEGPISKPRKAEKPPKPVLTGAAKWKKKAWDWSPYFVGACFGVWIVSQS